MDKFPAFFSRVVKLQSSERAWQTHERVTYILFFIHAFQSLEQEAVRKQALRLVSLPLWYSLSRGRLQVAHPFHSTAPLCFMGDTSLLCHARLLQKTQFYGHLSAFMWDTICLAMSLHHHQAFQHF